MSTTIRLSERKVREIIEMLDEWSAECLEIASYVQTEEEEASYSARSLAADAMGQFLLRALHAGDHGREIKGQV